MKETGVILMLLFLGLTACNQRENNQKEDEVLTEAIEYYVKINNSEEIEDGDFISENIIQSSRTPWIKGLIGDVLEGRKLAYSNMWFNYNESPEPLDIEILKKMLSPSRIYYQEVTLGQFEEKTEQIEFDYENIDGILFREKWFLNPSKEIKKEIIAFAPVHIVIDSRSGEKRGKQVMFWVKP
jgi:hypothetical protein